MPTYATQHSPAFHAGQPNVRAELEAKGHKIEVRGAFSSQMGGGQAVARDFAAGVNYGASDPRKDGEAIPEIPPEK